MLDVGSDLCSAELLNSFLSTADMATTGVVSAEVLRCVYDAYAHVGCRTPAQRWVRQPVAGRLQRWRPM